MDISSIVHIFSLLSIQPQTGDILNTTIHHQLIHWDTAAKKEKNKNLLGEEPLSVRIQGNPYSVMMRTPGDEISLVAGFCLTEGIIDSADDYISLAFCDGEDTNVIAVTLKPDRRNKIAKILDRRGFISQSSCGLCGKEIIEDLFQIIKPLEDDVRIDSKKALACLENIIQHQPLRKQTRAAHAAVLYSSQLEFLAAAEDVGRHNALDKVIGNVLLDGILDQAGLLILSSRISYELVQKAARARIPIILAISRPTALAVQLAAKLNITLATLADGPGLYIFCGAQRLIDS
jgi:FdhD protein